MCSSGTSATSFWVYHRFSSKAGRIRSIIAVALLTWIAADCRRRCGRGSLTGAWLPQLDLVPLGIDDPAELAVLRVVDLVQDVAPFRPERREQGVKVFHAVVDHERGCA